MVVCKLLVLKKKTPLIYSIPTAVSHSSSLRRAGLPGISTKHSTANYSKAQAHILISGLVTQWRKSQRTLSYSARTYLQRT